VAKAPPTAANNAVTPKAAAPVAPVAPAAPRKGPPPLRPESSPDLGARAVEPMRPRFETAPGVGLAPHGETPRPAAVSREDVEAMVRKGVADGVAAVLGETQRLLHALERRIDDLERRPMAAPVAPAPPMVTQAAAARGAAPVARPVYSPASGASAIPVTQGSLIPSMPHAPLLDVNAIERDTNIEMDSALDGRKRKRNLAIVTVVIILAVFGGLFAMLAQSYVPHP
jgi:hypothetical protein